jgi:hypothetical protein
MNIVGLRSIQNIHLGSQMQSTVNDIALKHE